jgi:hypothetical protein
MPDTVVRLCANHAEGVCSLMNIVSPSFGRRAQLAAALAISIAVGGVTSGAVAFAQDGTGAATPTPPTACEIVPATVTGEASGEVTPLASPVATEVVATPASGSIPVVYIGGSPEADQDTDAGTDSNEGATVDALTNDLQAASTAIAGCLSDGQYETLVQITGDEYRGQLLGIGFPLTADDFTLVAQALPQVPYQVISVENATTTSETTATADVTYELAHQVRLSTWQFELQEVGGENVWTLQSETSMTPVAPADTDTLTVDIADGAYTIADATVSGPSVAIQASNGDDVDHEVLVLRLADGVTTDDLLTAAGPSLPSGVTYIGQATVPAGGNGTLLLSGLQPGTYTIVDLLPNAEGLPNLADGMSITFNVE